jgi:acetyl-CoA carboxylase biotin carboxyl carrier protein
VIEKDKLISQLTVDEVLEILNLLEKSDFDFLRLEAGDLKLTVGKKGYHIGDDESPRAASTHPAGSSQPDLKLETRAAETSRTRTGAAAKTPVVEQGTVPIVAPMVGTFYTTPEPGAPPFVKNGDSVAASTTVGLIEVMKVFNAVTSKVTGIIVEVCVQNGQFVEYGQTLFLVKPEAD